MGRLAGLLAAPSCEQSGSDFERIATAAVPAGHPQRHAVGNLLQQIFGLLAAAAQQPQPAPMGTATPMGARAPTVAAAAAPAAQAAAAGAQASPAPVREARAVDQQGTKRRALAAIRNGGNGDQNMAEASEQAAMPGIAPITPYVPSGGNDGEISEDGETFWGNGQ